MRRALNLLRTSVDRRADFDAGLRANGYKVVERLEVPTPDDLLLCWNRYGGVHETAGRFEAVGAKVLVTENGYLGKAWRGGEWYALAIGHHAGLGQWPEGGDERWDALGVEMKPWQAGGSEIVIIGQRGIGEPNVKSPHQWAESMKRRIGGGRIRPHPGDAPSAPLERDLKDARCVVTWNSGAALSALLLGVPVFYDFDQWIGARASLPTSVWGAEPKRDDADRLAMFRRLAWAQWTIEEIRSGEAIARVSGR